LTQKNTGVEEEFLNNTSIQVLLQDEVL